MGTILFASDLDNTLLFSHRHRQPEDRCVERLNGAEQGFFTRETPDLLPQVVQRVHLLPITTRSIEQYQRIQWPDGTAPRIALTANGAVLLRDGQVDRAWHAASQALARDHRYAPAAVLDHLTRQGGATSVRCVEGVYVYAAYPDIPAAERVAELEEIDLAPLHAGYRAPYILAAARAVAAGELDLEKTGLLPCTEARAELKKLNGVGDKVANCVVLFGLHQLDAFPVDVWIKRALAENMPEGFEPSSLGKYAGLAQQYMFYHARETASGR